MEKRYLQYKSKASFLVLILILMSLTSIVGSQVNAEEGRSIGNEQILVTVISDHYDELSSITVAAALTGLNPGIDYDVSLTICYDASNLGAWENPSNGFSYDDYECDEHMLDAYVYDAEENEYQNFLWDNIIDIPTGVNSYALAKSIEFQRDSHIHPDLLGSFDCADTTTISNWTLINDGVDDCLDASDENYDYSNWPSEVIDASYHYNCTNWQSYGWDQPSLELSWFYYDGCGRGYYVVAELLVGDFELADSYSNSFAVGYRGEITFDALRESSVLSERLIDNGQELAPEYGDYTFEFGACELFHYISEHVEYNLNYQIQNLDDSSIVTSGTHSQIDSRSKTDSCSNQEYVSTSGLDAGNYSLTIDFSQEGVLLEHFIQDFSVDDTVITGEESLSIVTNDNYFNSTDSISVEIVTLGLSESTDYTVDLTLCWQRWDFSFPMVSTGGDYDDLERNCDEAPRPLIYDAENDTFEEEQALRVQNVLNTPSNSMTVLLHQEYESDVHPDNLGDYTCNDGSVIMGWTLINDGNSDCSDGSDENFDYTNWPSETVSASFNRAEIGYWFEAKLVAENYIVSDAFSNSFATGEQGYIHYSSLHPNGVLNGMNYDFDIRAKHIFRYIDELVEYDLNYNIFNSTSVLVASGTHSQIDSRALTAWASDWETFSISELNPGDYNLEIELIQEGVKISDYSKEFSIIDETLSNLETITVSVNSNHYDVDEDVELTLSLDNLFAGTNYEVTWQVCRDTYELNEFPNAADGTVYDKYDCPNRVGTGPQIYDISSDSYTDAWDIMSPIPPGSTSFSETVSIKSEYESDMDPWNLGDYTCNDGSVIFMGWTLINDGNSDCSDGSDENFDYANWPTEMIQNPLSNYVEQEGFYIIAKIHVAGFEVVDAFTDSFAIGNIGGIMFGSSHESGVLAGMDYKFQYSACELFRYINVPVYYNLDYWVSDDDGLITSGTHALINTRGIEDYCSNHELVIISGLTVDQGKRNKQYNLKISLSSLSNIIDEMELDFTITDPLAPNDDATLELLTSTGLNGVGVVEFTVDEMSEGQYYEVVYTLGIAGGQPEVGNYIIIAPPTKNVETMTFPHLKDGFYCISANLMINNWELRSTSACFNQMSTIDSDGDGIRDVEDNCPNVDSSMGQDSDGDGCIEYSDSDFDGWDDIIEIQCGTDEFWEESYPFDLDGDGICDGLDLDTDGDGVEDLVEIAAGTDPSDDQSKPNTPPTCDIYYALEASGIIIANDNLMISAVPSGTPTVPMNITVTLPVGNYYLIAFCSDSEGDLISVNLNGEIIGPTAEATVGALVSLAPDTSETVGLFLAYDDGVHFLAAEITVNLGSTGLPSVVDENTGQGVPGFTGIFTIIALIGAASLKIRKNE